MLRKRRPKAETPNLLRADENLVSNSQEICNAMNKHFVVIGKKLSAKVPIDANHEWMYKQFLGKRQSSSIVMQTTDDNEVIEIISGLNSSKSLGYIDIPTALFTESKFLIARHLALAFNECLCKRNYLNIFEIANVIPLHKGSSKLELGNYRLSSVTRESGGLEPPIDLKRTQKTTFLVLLRPIFARKMKKTPPAGLASRSCEGLGGILTRKLNFFFWTSPKVGQEN